MASRSRTFLKNQALTASLHHARTVARAYADDVDIMGIGVRRLQLVHRHSFVDGTLYEVRQLENYWSAFRAVAPLGTERCVGYDRLNIDSARLRDYFERLRGTKLRISPDLSGMGGSDGQTFQLTVYGDMFSEIRFQWWCEPPSEWSEVAAIYSELKSVLTASEVDADFG